MWNSAVLDVRRFVFWRLWTCVCVNCTGRVHSAAYSLSFWTTEHGEIPAGARCFSDGRYQGNCCHCWCHWCDQFYCHLISFTFKGSQTLDVSICDEADLGWWHSQSDKPGGRWLLLSDGFRLACGYLPSSVSTWQYSLQKVSHRWRAVQGQSHGAVVWGIGGSVQRLHFANNAVRIGVLGFIESWCQKDWCTGSVVPEEDPWYTLVPRCFQPRSEAYDGTASPHGYHTKKKTDVVWPPGQNGQDSWCQKDSDWCPSEWLE